MRTWSIQDAKARFSELLDTCLREGPQLVTKHGADAAVLVPIDDWHRLQRSAGSPLKDLLLSEEARFEFTPVKRGSRRHTPRALD